MVLSNIFVIFFLITFIISSVIKFFLDIINYLHRKKYSNYIPEELKDIVDKEKLLKINNYSNDKLKLNIFHYVISNIILLFILFSGIISKYYYFLNNFFKSNKYLLCLIFFFSYFLLEFIIDIPFSLYQNFVIEKKYEFNTMNLKIWVSDLIKSFIISVIIGFLILSVLYIFIFYFEKIWWFLLWIFLIIFSFIMQLIYPAIIAPLFNKFNPVENKELIDKVEKLFKNAGLKLSGLFVMDASKRSRHTNAYFTGIGKTKRVVLFDNLMNKHSIDEIVSIIAHELGHYKYKHIILQYLISSIIYFFGLYFINFFINNEILYQGFNIDKIDKIIGLFIMSIIISPVQFLFMPLRSIISRKFEYQADNYCKKEIGTPNFLIDSLKKLYIDNLSSIYPNKIYAWFYYSHPTLLDRIKNLQK